MEKVSAAELTREFAKLRAKALRSALTITHQGQDDLVLLAAGEYQRLKKLDDQVAMPVEALSGTDLDALDETEIPQEAAQFNHEVPENW